jgi:hypothetical protein
LAKALPLSVVADGRLMNDKFLQSLKAAFPMLVTDGKSTDDNFEHA